MESINFITLFTGDIKVDTQPQGVEMLSAKVFSRIWDTEGGKQFLVNVANQYEAKLLGKDFLKKLSTIISKEPDEFSVTIKNHKCAEMLFNLPGPTIDPVNSNIKLLRVAPWNRLLAAIIRSNEKMNQTVNNLNDEHVSHKKRINDILSQNAINADLIAEIRSIEAKILDNFNIAATPGLHGRKWISASIQAINFRPEEKDKAVFCTSTSSDHFESRIWDNLPSCGRGDADRARDLLGMVHIGKFRALGAFYFDFPVSGTKLNRPTAIDAGNHKRFRSTYGRLGGNVGEWGRGFDLSSLYDSPSHGGREIVSKNFKPRQIHFTFLGIPHCESDIGNLANDNDFLNVLLDGRSRDDLEQLLC